MYKELDETMMKICLIHIPRKINKNRSIIPRDRKILMRQRTKLRKKYASKSSAFYKTTLSKKISNIEIKIATSHDEEFEWKESLAISKIKEDPKYFCKYAKKKSTAKSSVGPFLVGDIYVNDPGKKAEILLKQYESVFSPSGYSTEIIEKISECPGQRSLDDLNFGTEDIEEAIDSLANNSSPGPDEIPTLLQKNAKIP